MNPIERVSLVTQTFPPRMGGMEAVMQSLAKHFADLGANVSIFPDRAAPACKSYKSFLIPAPKLVRHIVKRVLVDKNCESSDLIICDSWKSVKAVPRRFKNLIVLAHGQEYLNTTNRATEILSALQRAQVIVCSSNATKNLVNNFSPSTENKSHTVYPTYMLTAPAAKTEHRKPTDFVRICSISRLEKRKGLQNALQALARLKDQGFRFEWKICGAGPASEELIELTSRLGLKKEVWFRGRIPEEDKYKVFQDSDLFLMPSYREGDSLEGFGISYVEAGSFGIPSIGGIAGGASEAVNAPTCGWVCDGSDPESIHQALYEAFKDPKNRVERGRKAAQLFRERFIGDTVFKTLLQIYQESSHEKQRV